MPAQPWSAENIEHLKARAAQLALEVSMAQSVARTATRKAIKLGQHFGLTPEQMEGILEKPEAPAAMEFHLHHHHHFPEPFQVKLDNCPHVAGQLNRIENFVTHILQHNIKIMASLDQIKAAQAEALKTLAESKDLLVGLDTFVQNIADQLAEALKLAGASDEILAAATAITDGVKANLALIVAAGNVNTPAETPADAQAVATAGL